MRDDLTKLVPKSAVILNVIRVVEYMDADGVIHKDDFSYGGDGEDIEMGKALELIEWARAFTLSPTYLEMFHQFMSEEEGEDEEDDFA
ncbi:hypothetical protein A5747_13470 [Mycobacterium sp. IS-836]|uniref:hypothetical protein n=1 Tax=Mycobacterium sp. IS-836 TaxID=1834160 RepID=UPI00097B79DB|nr:hypothetical protein [Mycobacterium sp. IS-836]OMC55397.1 hypothetical protein A5747_13470 [Mycobacterium sp. IS-836]